MLRFFVLGLLLFVPATAMADGPKDNIPDNVRRIPPPGVKVPDAERKELEAALGVLALEIERLKIANKGGELNTLLPDVEVFWKAVHDALKYDEIFDLKDLPIVKKHLATGLARAKALAEGKSPWLSEPGLVVRGYRSKIDGSVQPYGLLIPKDAIASPGTPRRLDVWCHGRGEVLSELRFCNNPSTMPPEFVRPGAFVLYLYGRYCCANKLAGEIDCFEAMDHLKKRFTIDENRQVIRGFSMGGAACWQFAVHYPSVWCAAGPGAGFSETPDFLKVFQDEDTSNAPWYEKKLWHMYDCTGYALNLFNLPTVAYSGEIDKQKQAADMMEKAMKAEGLQLTHIIGPKTGHTYHLDSRKHINELIDPIVEVGRNPVPKKVKFVTYTLRYNKSFWVSIYGLDQHWERAQIEAEIVGKNRIKIAAKNVNALEVSIPSAQNPFDGDLIVEVDGKECAPVGKNRDGTVSGRFYKDAEKGWISALPPWSEIDGGVWKKRPGLQGPIDDAFLDSFVMVQPTGTPYSMKAGMWYAAEMKHAITHWRQQFRGEAPMKADKDITDDDIKNSNLILWGDPASNAVLKRIADKLPVKWDADNGKLKLGNESFESSTHVPLLIYPNPLNPKKYVVLNSGFTFREYDYLNNARQVPKLPDYAIVDTDSPVTSRYPGKIVTAGFFDEKWQLNAKK